MHPITDPPGSHRQGEQRVTVKRAGEILGISPEAVRARIKRGTLHKEKGEDGTVYVRLDADRAQWDGDGSDGGSGDGTHHEIGVERELRAQVEILRAQLEEANAANRENRRIIAALTQRVPEIEPSKEAPLDVRDGDLTASKEPGGVRGGHSVSQEPEQRRSWLYRFFFGP
jgi:hypothetical protein